MAKNIDGRPLTLSRGESSDRSSDAWSRHESKTNPGRFYFFNRFTNEKIWADQKSNTKNRDPETSKFKSRKSVGRKKDVNANRPSVDISKNSKEQQRRLPRPKRNLNDDDKERPISPACKKSKNHGALKSRGKVDSHEVSKSRQSKEGISADKKETLVASKEKAGSKLAVLSKRPKNETDTKLRRLIAMRRRSSKEAERPSIGRRSSAEMPDREAFIEPATTSQEDVEKMEWEDLPVMEDVYMRPVFNELSLKEEVSFLDPARCVDLSLNDIDAFVVVDTCVYISNFPALNKWNENKDNEFALFLPWIVLQELDGLKAGKASSSTFELQKKARLAVRGINRWISDPVLKSRTLLENGAEFRDRHRHFELGTNDDKILNVAVDLAQSSKVLLVSNDINMRNKAGSFKLVSCDFKDMMMTLKNRELIPNSLCAKRVTTAPNLTTSVNKNLQHLLPSKNAIKPAVTIPEKIDNFSSETEKKLADHSSKIYEIFLSLYYDSEDDAMQIIYAEFRACALIAFSAVIHREFLLAYGEKLWWDIVISKPEVDGPPFLWRDLSDVDKCFEKHWMAVFGYAFGRHNQDKFKNVLSFLTSIDKSFDASALRERLGIFVDILTIVHRPSNSSSPTLERISFLESICPNIGSTASDSNSVFSIFDQLWVALNDLVSRKSILKDDAMLISLIRHFTKELASSLEVLLSPGRDNLRRPDAAAVRNSLYLLFHGLNLISVNWPETCSIVGRLRTCPMHRLTADNILAFISSGVENFELTQRGARQLREFEALLLLFRD